MKKLLVLISLSFIISFSYSQDTTTVVLDYTACCQTSATEYSLGPYHIYIPNVFTPNYDGVNDVFFPYVSDNIGEIKSIRISVSEGLPNPIDIYFREELSLDSLEQIYWNGWNAFDSSFVSGVFNYEFKFDLPTGQEVVLQGSACSVICNSYDDEVQINAGNCRTADQATIIGKLDASVKTSDPCL